jgi:TonB-linked SusC/RagA family outer membrane protein
MKKFLLVCFTFVFALGVAWAQERTISGKVRSPEDGSALPGVNVVLKGTTNGTVTDTDGNYKLTVPGAGGTLVFSFIGFTTKEVDIGNQTNIDIQLDLDTKQLSEVVVTALGIESERRSLGTAISELKADKFVDTRQTNIVNSLTAKIAGVRVQSSNGMVGSSSSIFIRGMTSFTASNQPLFVVDGIPIDNSGGGNALQTGVSNSNRAIDLNPDDIESMSVLKGPAAAVLYGSRAVAGAILITTKKGSNKQKNTVEFTTNYNRTEVNRLPDYQNTYAQGNNGIYNATSLDSWGPKINGQTVTNYLGNAEKLTAYPRNVKDIFKDGSNIQNSVSLKGGNEKSNYIFSYSNLQEDGVLQKNTLNRNTFKVGANSQLTSKFSAGANVTYFNTQSTRTPIGNTQANPMFRGYIIPRSYNINNYPYQLPNGTQSYYDTSTDNPYWSMENNTYKDRVDRILAQFNVQYDFTDWLSASYRLGTDTYVHNIRQIDGIGSVGNASGAGAATTGGMADENIFVSQTSSYLNITAKKTFGDFNTTLLIGNEVNQSYTRDQGTTATGATVGGFSQISSYTTYTPFNADNRRRLIGLYAQATIGYKDYLYLTLTGRNDWSSTFSKGKNSFFYPSANLSFVYTDAFPGIKDIGFITFGKLRASVVKVGREAPIYSTDTYFAKSSPASGFGPSIVYPFRGQMAYTLSNAAGNPNISPEFTTSFDVGTEMRFWKDKISVDFGYFETHTTDIILAAPTSVGSGFSSQVRNAGELRTNGLELSLGITPIKTGDFSWNINANWTRIRNNVIKIDPLVNSIFLGGFTTPQTQLQAGQPYGVIVGNPFFKDANGNILITTTGAGAGQPTADAATSAVVGNPNPDWTGGITNTFNYKAFTFSFLFDLRVGGDIISRNIRDIRFRGVGAETGDRDKTYIVPGVLRDPVNEPGTNLPRPLLAADGSTIPNNIALTAQQYWTSIYNTQGESIVFDGSWARLREMSLTYNFPKSMLAKTPFGSASIVLTGRNLWLYAPNYPHFDPEVNTQGVSNSQGFEFNTLPQTRSFGVLVRFTL